MPTVAVAGGSRSDILELVRHSRVEGNEDLTFKVFDVDPNIDTEGLWEYTPCENEGDMVYQTVKCVADGKADILLKSGVQTHALLKEVLKKEHGLRNQDLLSHVVLVDLPQLKRPILLTDSGMNIAPTIDQLEVIIENAIETSKRIGLTKPKVALLSAAENLNPKMSSSVMANELTERFSTNSNATVYGPLSLDLSLSKEAVKSKRFEGPIQGDADILVVPGIDAGNVLYKSFVLFGGARMGGSIVGAKAPIVLTSRSDQVKSKLYGLEFALMQLKK